eukprot:2114273-Amphidinium_carterae.1
MACGVRGEGPKCLKCFGCPTNRLGRLVPRLVSLPDGALSAVDLSPAKRGGGRVQCLCCRHVPENAILIACCEALDLQRSIKVAPRRDGSNARATALRREATAALHGLFTFGAEDICSTPSPHLLLRVEVYRTITSHTKRVEVGF